MALRSLAAMSFFFSSRASETRTLDLVHVHRRPGFAGYLRSPRVNRGDRRRGPGGVGNQLGSGQTLTGSVGRLFQNPGAGFHVDAAIEGDEEQGGEVESASTVE